LSSKKDELFRAQMLYFKDGDPCPEPIDG